VIILAPQDPEGKKLRRTGIEVPMASAGARAYNRDQGSEQGVREANPPEDETFQFLEIQQK